ncbi:uncharacterized protein LOC114419620 [Glycine soja]|uniref:TFIIS N-terminal domain-containing protein n=2 Tax=Glycine subgen. Soja TaxID=1462606 RepID=A0A0R0JDB8_SOYBN|nr:uncharacterized protein LOC114419620 [Glycine soja]RZC03858.1 hypothetical protein D0Y65_018488 [Glycine soja]|eukprot:XP_006583846.1 uncharacterized protein LOC102661199 [Glycine max]
MEKENSDKEEYVMMLQRCVKKLHFGSREEKEVAAKVIEEGLAKQDVVKVREMTSELGVVRVLVSMAVSEVASRHRVGLKALIHLSNGTHGNKALIVEAGILSILPKKIDLEDESISEFAHLLSSLSSQGTIKRRQDSACTNRNKTQWNDSSFFSTPPYSANSQVLLANSQVQYHHISSIHQNIKQKPV